MKKLIFLFAIALWSVTANGISIINPQTGETVWEVSSNIGAVIDEINLYKPLVISNADASGGVITISSPGIYRLSEELTNRIVIDASNVELDLNGYGISLSTNVSGITIASDNTNIIIHHGYIKNTNTATPGYGIAAAPNAGEVIAGVYIEGVHVFGFYDGVHLVKGTGILKNFYMVNCSCNGCGYIGCYFDGLSESVFDKYFAFECGEAGFWLLNAGNNNLFKECISSNNTLYGFRIATNYNTFMRCEASKNTAGFRIEYAALNMFRKCLTSENIQMGFYVTNDGATGSQNFFEKCIAVRNNPSGSTAQTYGGFVTNNEDHISFEQCVSSHNGYYGFFANNIADYFLLDECISKQNDTNYLFQSGNAVTYRCQDVGTASFSWKDSIGTTGWMARG